MLDRVVFHTNHNIRMLQHSYILHAFDDMSVARDGEWYDNVFYIIESQKV